MKSADDARHFVRTSTKLSAPAMVPEIRIHQATEVTALWQATESYLDTIGLPPPYWAFPWPGSQALARYILDHPSEFAGRRVADIGAGNGLASIAAALAGAARVVAIDPDPFAAAAATENARANGVTLDIRIRDGTLDLPEGTDLVIAGDVCYERAMAERLVPALRRAAAAGIRVLLADPGRAYLPKEGLVELARYGVPTSRELEDREVRETTIWLILP